MSLVVKVQDDESMIEIAIEGSFDFSLFNEFRHSYEPFLNRSRTYVINLAQVAYLDSAALGMLISMRNAVGEKSEVSLVNANDFIKNILKISRFDKRFIIP